MNEKEKNKAIEEALGSLHKKYGKESVVALNSDLGLNIESIPTGCFALDEAFGCGGLPKGRIIELFGEESAGKSTVATFLMAQVQKAGGKVMLVDAEFSFDAGYAQNIGLNIRDLILSQPSTLEEAMDVVNEIVKSSAVDLIVVDSVASMVPKSELEGAEMLKDSVAVQARLMAKALRILTGSIAKSKTIVIFINQTRDKVGVFFGNKSTTPGGKALKFYSSVRIDVKKGEKKEGKNKEIIGYTLKTTMVKNKVGYPWKTASFDLYFGDGIDLYTDTIDYGEKVGVIERSGASYSFGDKKLGIGKEQVKGLLKSDEKLYNEIREAIVKAIENQDKLQDTNNN